MMRALRRPSRFPLLPMAKLAASIALLAAATAVGQSSPSTEPTADATVVARVADATITAGDVNAVLIAAGQSKDQWPRYRNLATRTAIEDALRQQFISSRSVRVDEAALEAITTQRHRALQQKANRDGYLSLPKQRVRASVKLQLMFRSAVEQGITDDAVERAQQRVGPWMDGRTVALRQILIRAAPSDDHRRVAYAQKRATLLKAAIDGEAVGFEAAATRFSEVAVGEKTRGGAIGTFAFAELSLPAAEAVFAARPGDVVGPIRTTAGFHLFRIERRIPAASPTEPTEQAVRRMLLNHRLHHATLIDVSQRATVTWEDYDGPTIDDAPLPDLPPRS